jgi:hypothetical protein
MVLMVSVLSPWLIDPGPVMRQNIMVVGACIRGYSHHGGQEAKRERCPGQDSIPQGLTPSNLLPPSMPHILKFLETSKTAPPLETKHSAYGVSGKIHFQQ